MRFLGILSPAEQVASYLRLALRCGRWTGSMPGVIRLEAELGVHRNTIEAALRLLEVEGLLTPQGPGRPRLISVTVENSEQPSLRIGILLYEHADKGLNYIVEILHLLTEAGHIPFFAGKYLSELSMDVERVARVVQMCDAHAWIVAGASLDVLQWFENQAQPAFALFGFVSDARLPGAGPIKSPAYIDAVRALVAYGHHRIVLLARSDRRKPKPGVSEQTFLDTLMSEGICVGDYNLPDWKNNKHSFHQCLNSLFSVTPPTALIVQEAPLFAAVQQFLAARGLKVPGDVSLICTDPDPIFTWSHQTIAHIRWDAAPLIRRIVNWAKNVSRGKDDFRKRYPRAEFINGGTVGPAPDKQ